MMASPRSTLLMCLYVVTVLGAASAGWAAGVTNGAGPGLVAMVQSQPSTGDFEPVSQLPDTEQLPAAPLLVGAYIVVWLVILVYLLSLWRRMVAVDREIADIERRLGEQRRS